MRRSALNRSTYESYLAYLYGLQDQVRITSLQRMFAQRVFILQPQV